MSPVIRTAREPYGCTVWCPLGEDEEPPTDALPDRDQPGLGGSQQRVGATEHVDRRLALRLALVCPGRFPKGCQSVLSHPPGVNVTG